MLYNNNGYTIEIPDNIYWDLSDDEFNEYINTKYVESFNITENRFSITSFTIELPDEE